MRTHMEEDIDVVRNHLGEVMVELEGWGPRATGVPARLRENARPLALGTVALAAAAVGLWWARAQTRRSVVERALAHLPASVRPASPSRKMMRDVKNRLAMVRRPQPVSHPLRSLFYKISTAGLVAAASVVARHLAAHFVEKQWRSASPNKQDNLAANFGR